MTALLFSGLSKRGSHPDAHPKRVERGASRLVAKTGEASGSGVSTIGSGSGSGIGSGSRTGSTIYMKRIESLDVKKIQMKRHCCR